MEAPLFKRCLAEGMGTLALVFFGIGAVMVDSISGGAIGHIGVAAAFGLVILAMIYTFGDTSGAHFNPAVSLGFWAGGLFPTKELLPYVASQFLGAIAGSLLLSLLFPGLESLGLTLPSDTIFQTFLLEVLLTFFLMLVILFVSQGASIMAGLSVGVTVGLCALVGGPISGASMNPARSLAPAAVSMEFQQLWIYFVATAIGAVLAALFWKLYEELV